MATQRITPPDRADGLESSTHSSCVCCVIHPDLLGRVATSNTRSQRVRLAALQTLQIDASLRSARVAGLERARFRRAIRRARLARALVDRLTAAMPPEKRRAVYDAAHKTRLPGTLVRSEGQPASADPTVNEAYDALGATWDFYFNVFERNSIDDKGQQLIGTAHYSADYDNAFYDGRQMVFGDGDGQIFAPFTRSVDVVGHELTHGVIQAEAALIYWGQAGALNESLADVFGAMVKQYQLGETADVADWLIGEGLFIPGAVEPGASGGAALRSLKQPGTAYGYPVKDPELGQDPQPAHMSKFVRTLKDNGGVHTNSGIPSHAFYLAATNLGGHSWERAGRIWYETLQDPLLRPTANFRDFARLTARTAGRVYGSGSEERAAVREAWAQVGVSVSRSVLVR
jgi:Zn-dependent metalloprotease